MKVSELMTGSTASESSDRAACPMKKVTIGCAARLTTEVQASGR